MKRFWVFGIAAIVLLTIGFDALGRGGGSSTEPFYLFPAQNITNVTVPRVTQSYYGIGYTTQNCAASLGTKRVVIAVGQSVTAGNVNATYTVTQANNWQMDVQSGGCYTMKEPLLGATMSGFPPNKGNYFAEVGDKLIAGGAAHVITLNASAGGSKIADWTTGGQLFQSIAVIGRRLSQAGLTCTNIIWGQGESDHATAGATYTSGLTAVVNEFRTQGMNCNFHINIETMIASVTSATIQTAQSNATTGTNVVAGFNMDTGVPDSGGNRYDGTHLAASGRGLASTGVANNILAH